MNSEICTRCGKHEFPTIQVLNRGVLVDTYCDECEDKRLVETYADNGRVNLKLLDRLAGGSLKRLILSHLMYNMLLNDSRTVFQALRGFDSTILKGMPEIYNFLWGDPSRQHRLDTPTIRVTALRHADGITLNITRVTKPDPWISLWLASVFPTDVLAVNGKPSEIEDLFKELTQVLKVQGTGIFVHTNDLVPTH